MITIKQLFAHTEEFLNKCDQKLLWTFVIAIGTLARILISLRGYNLDFYSWTENALEMRNGRSVYSGNVPYGYGPVWMFVIKFADVVQNFFKSTPGIFRITIILVLSSFDFALTYFLAKMKSITVGLLFFINPISVIISGYHNQFDNMAIVIGLAAIITLVPESVNRSNRFEWLGLSLLGLSLAVKQVFLFFPVWLFLRDGSLRQRLSRLIVPYVVYLASFIPWVTSIDRAKYIIKDVFLQGRGRSGILLSLIGADHPGVIQGSSYGDISRQLIFLAWIFGVLVFGFLLRAAPITHQFILYLAIMVAFAPAYSQQQLVLPLLAVFVYATIELKIFYLLTLLFMIQNSDELGYEFLFPHFFRLNGTIYAWLQVLLLIFALRIVFPDHPQNLKSRHLQSALKLD